MTDSTQPHDVAGLPSGAGQGMTRMATDRAAAAGVPAHALERAPWRTLPPAEPWRSPLPHAAEPERSAS